MTDDRTYQEPDYRATAGEFIRHVAAEWGDRELAVIDDHRLTFAEAEAESARLAKALLASGVKAGTHVALLAPNGPDWIVGFLAATRIGAPVPLLNTYYKPRELGWVLEHCDAEVVLTVGSHLGHDYVERLEQIAPGLADQAHGEIRVDSHPTLRTVWMWNDDAPQWAAPIDDLLARADEVSDRDLLEAEASLRPNDAMLVIYTSGSTAEPKGVIHSHGGVIRHPYNLLPFRDLEPGDICYTPMPLFWVGGLTYTLISCMHAGASVVFEQQFEPGDTLALIEREKVTHVVGWPHMAKALTEHPSFGDRDLSSVRGGSLDALLPPEHRVGDPELRANSLGMTESLGPHSIEMIGSELPPEKRGSFGRSVPGMEHRIVDPISGKDQPPGEMGEIWIKGYSLMLGHLKKSRRDVFTKDGWLPTGDAGFLDSDGHLFFKGRMGDQIKSSGMNITPREVELVIEEQPEVMHAFVMAVPHAERGEDVAAAIVFRPDQSAEPADLQGRLKAEMASYKVPRHIATYGAPTELPWLESGKIDRRALQQSLVDRFTEGS
ncbi:MAG: class I adenylate-forming enzyme family protein [Acidimicrobiales bacterium]|jgi:acyl-CoA synthetase (AMP-forming)/AMP-acid ligase II|nr:class I adenylate-forming enzyme family protein [Acidimicrobiales bacterium]